MILKVHTRRGDLVLEPRCRRAGWRIALGTSERGEQHSQCRAAIVSHEIGMRECSRLAY